MRSLEQWAQEAPDSEVIEISKKIQSSMEKKAKRKAWSSQGEIMSVEDIAEMLKSGPYECTFTGEKLYPSPSFGDEFSCSQELQHWSNARLSWDRVDPTRTYEKGNVVMCSMFFNKLKGSMSLKSLEKTLESVIKFKTKGV